VVENQGQKLEVFKNFAIAVFAKEHNACKLQQLEGRDVKVNTKSNKL
jgi:hypothetical protein